MSKKRLVYIAGLSGADDIGDFVREDMDNIKKVLENYENEGQIILRTDEYISRRNVIRRFMDNKILPWLFYYSGHSDDNEIVFSNGPMSTDTFVGILDDDRVREQLQLVYLGSCNSITIGNKLIEKGIKVVIASDKEVRPYLSNIISQFFFNNLFTSENIQKAFDRTVKLFDADRSSFNVNATTNFPWHLLTSSETNLEKSIKPIRLSAEQKHKMVMNTASMRLELLDYYISHDLSPEKNTSVIKEEVEEMRKTLDNTLEIINENENIQSLIRPWKNNLTFDLIPKKERLMSTSRVIKNLNLPQNFLKSTVNQVEKMKEYSNDILNF